MKKTIRANIEDGEVIQGVLLISFIMFPIYPFLQYFPVFYSLKWSFFVVFEFLYSNYVSAKWETHLEMLLSFMNFLQINLKFPEVTIYY